MNKLFTKIVGAALGLTMAIGVGLTVASNSEAAKVDAASVVSGTTGSLTFSSDHKVSSSGNTINDTADATWTFTTDSEYTALDGGSIHTGSSSKTCSHQTWTTGDYSSVTITKVVVNAKMASSSSVSASVTINGNSVGSSQNITASAADYTFTNSSSYKGGNLVVKLSRSSASKKAIYCYSITVSYSAGTTYSASLGSGSHATLTGTTSVSSGSALDINIVPDTHYHLPDSLISVTMGGSTYAGYTYTKATGRFQIASVTGNVVINVTCPQDSKYDVIYTAGTNGSGTFTISDQWAGSYTLPAYSGISGTEKVNANDGYAFKDYTVGGETKNPGETISLGSLTYVTVNFKVQPKEAKYEPTSATAASMTEGIAPTGSGITFNNTYTSNKVQVTGSNTMTWTLTGYTGYNIKSIKAHARNNKSSGAATATLTNNAASVTPLERSNFSGLGDTFAEYEILKSKIEVKGNVVLTFSCSTSSLYCDYILVEWEQSNVLSENLIISNPTTSFTVGDTFEIGDTVYAYYSLTGNTPVTSDVTLDLAGVGTISEDDTITSDWVGTKEVGVYYEDEGGAEASTAYNITVSYAKVTLVEITNYPSTGELPKDGEFTFGATVLPATANPAVKWSASSETLVENDDFCINEDTGELTLTASEGGTITITATTVGKTAGDTTLSDTYDLEVTGNPVVTLNQSALAGFSEKTGSLTAEAANFGGAVTYSWSSDNACVTVPNINVATNTLTYASAGTAIITVTATYQSQSASATCTVTVTASTVTSLSWSASNFDVYDNQSLSALPGTLTAIWNNDDITHPTSGYTLAIGGSSISLPHAWSTNDDGKLFTVTYGGQSASVSIQVTEHLNKITETSWTKVTDATTLTAGDKLVIASDSKGTVATDISSQIMGKVDTEFKDGKISGDLDSSAVQLTLDGTSGAWTLQNSAGKYLSATAEKKLAWADSSTGNTWTISISSGDATITFATSSYGKFMYNVSSPRFTTYTSSASATMLLVQLYRNKNTPINDTNSTAQRALLSYVATFNSTMDCDDGGATTNVESKWSSASSAFTTAMNALGTDDKTVFKRLVANASAVEGGDRLQDMLARYDYIIAKYKLSNDFLHDGADRGAVQYARVTPFNIIGNNGNTVAIIVVISMISVTCIGGYFFLRKRKEN